MQEQLRIVNGEIVGMQDRISAAGDRFVELRVNTGARSERCLAYAQKAEQLRGLLRRLGVLARRKGLRRIADLRVRIEICGIDRSAPPAAGVLVTGIRLVRA